MMIRNKYPASLSLLLTGACYHLELLLWKLLPQGDELNAVLGGLWTIGQAGVLIILAHIYRSGVARPGRWTNACIAVAALGAVSYSVNYIFGYWLQLNTRAFLPLGALLTGTGMLLLGVRVVIARRWSGYLRFMPLAVGLYPFCVMFPLLAITGHPDLTAILGWGIPWMILGMGMVRAGSWSSA